MTEPEIDVRARVLTTLDRFVSGQATVDATLCEAVEVALDAVSAAAMAGLTLVGDRNEPKTQVSTSPRARAVDEAQYAQGVGPCLDAYRQRRVVHVPDVGAAGAEYPAYAATAQQVGIASTLSVPLLLGEEPVGAVNLYAERPAVFDERSAHIAADVCTVAASVMAIVARYGDALDANEQLKQAMESRATIEQAKGIVMATMRCSADDAFDVLRQQSQNENRKLRDIALELVERRSPR